jgi:hypothetical protein
LESTASTSCDRFRAILGSHPRRTSPRHHSSPEFLSQAVRELRIARGEKKLSHAVRELLSAVPWGHHADALARVSDPAARFYYLRAAAHFGWSRDVLLNQIKARAYERAVKEKKSHNFSLALPGPLAKRADQILKSSYNLEFLGVAQAIQERELEGMSDTRLLRSVEHSPYVCWK